MPSPKSRTSSSLTITPPPSPSSSSPSPYPSYSARASLLGLPFDLHHLLIKHHLSYTSLRSLRCTCSYFRQYIPVRFLRRVRRRTVKSLARQESEEWTVWLRLHGPGHSVNGVWEFYPLYLACYECLERWPRCAFTESQTRWVGHAFPRIKIVAI